LAFDTGGHVSGSLKLRIVFGEEALSYLERLQASARSSSPTSVIVKLGHAARVQEMLTSAGFKVRILMRRVRPFDRDGAGRCGGDGRVQPEWIIALGGGSVIDAAKAMWILYERPDVTRRASTD